MAKNETEEEKKAREVIEEIAKNISDLSKGVSALLSGRLKRKTILILLCHSTGMKQGEVNTVLSALENMGNTHLK